jgi:hypothetical protein
MTAIAARFCIMPLLQAVFIRRAIPSVGRTAYNFVSTFFQKNVESFFANCNDNRKSNDIPNLSQVSKRGRDLPRKEVRQHLSNRRFSVWNTPVLRQFTRFFGFQPSVKH